MEINLEQLSNTLKNATKIYYVNTDEIIAEDASGAYTALNWRDYGVTVTVFEKRPEEKPQITGTGYYNGDWEAVVNLLNTLEQVEIFCKWHIPNYTLKYGVEAPVWVCSDLNDLKLHDRVAISSLTIDEFNTSDLFYRWSRKKSAFKYSDNLYLLPVEYIYHAGAMVFKVVEKK